MPQDGRGNMTSTRCLEFLLLLLCCRVHGDDPEPTFRTKGSNIEMGYCFGADYILVYRSTPEGDRLLGNSSDGAAPVAPPADLQGRIQMSRQELLLGLQILNLTRTDAGAYRKECWENGTQVSQLTQQLLVCDEETHPVEVEASGEGARTELRCSSPLARLEGTSVRWYNEMYPSYKLTLFLDSSVSLEPLREDLRSRVEARDDGTSLMIDTELLKNNQQFYCLVFKGEKCLSLQNLFLPDRSVSRDVFASEGEPVVLHCPPDGYNQHWDTPSGSVNGSGTTQKQMRLNTADNDFSLIMDSFSDELAGDYSCISSSLEMQYFLYLCPEKVRAPKQSVAEGQDVTLVCGEEQTNQRVLWNRKREQDHAAEPIHDSRDGTVPVPEDLAERLSFSSGGGSMTVSKWQSTDEGKYTCVKFGGSDYTFVDYDGTEEGDEDGEDAPVDEDYIDEQSWGEPQKCIFRQETVLTGKDGGEKPIENKATAEPPQPAFIIAGVVGGLVAVAVLIGVMVFMRKKKQRSTTNNGPKTREGPVDENLL